MSGLVSYFLGLFAAIIVLLGLALFAFRQLRLRPEEGLALAALSETFAVYLFAHVGRAWIGVILLGLMALMGLVLGFSGRRLTKAGLIKQQNTPALSSFFTPGILLFLLGALLASLSFYGTCYQNWDEFVQWGKALRYLGSTGALPVGPDYDGLGYMQSATSFFHYFTGCFTGFDEGASYVSNALLCLAPLPLALMDSEKKGGLLRAGAFFLFLLLALYGLYDLPFYNLYTDMALSLWTGSLIYYGIRMLTPGAALSSWVLAGLMLLFISFSKPQVGLLFAGISLLAILVLLPKGKEKRAPRPALSKKQKLLFALLAILAVALPILVKKLWDGKLSATEGIYFNLYFLKELLSGKGNLREVFYVLYKGLFTPLARIDALSYAACFFVAGGLVTLGGLLLPRNGERSRFLRIGVLYLLGFAAYFAVVLLTYLLILPPSDAANGTSLDRYLSLYVMAGLVPLSAPFFRGAAGFETADDQPAPGSLRGVLLSGVCLFLILGLGCPVKSDLLYALTPALRWDDPYYKMYMQVRAQAERVTALTGDAPIYYINQEYDSAAAAAEYAFSHQWSRSTGPYRFAEAGTGATTGLVDTPVSQLPERLRATGCRYLYIGATDDYLSQVFPSLFACPAPNSGDLYEITAAGDALTLTLVENVAANAPDPRAVERAH